MRKLTPNLVSQRFGVSKVTVIAWCDAGLLHAVNVARPGSTRKRWRMSEDDVDQFMEHRQNRQLEAVAS